MSILSSLELAFFVTNWEDSAYYYCNTSILAICGGAVWENRRLSQHNNDSYETRILLARYITVALAVPILGGMLAYLAFEYFEWERNAGNLKRSVLVIWLGTMFALGIALFTHLRARPKEGYRRQVVSRMDWERRSSSKSVQSVARAFICIPAFTLIYLTIYHFCWQGFETSKEIRTLVATAVPLWILCSSWIAYRTRGQRIG